MKTLEGNKLIAEFMGGKHIPATGRSIEVFEFNDQNLRGTFTVNENDSGYLTPLSYDKSWDWLMPVVEKIENLGFEFFIVENRCKVKHNTDKSIEVLSYLEGGTKLEITYQTVVEFIKWYNENK